ncbi:hypothetical protein M513_03476, partial [Trichuris suis]
GWRSKQSPEMGVPKPDRRGAGHHRVQPSRHPSVRIRKKRGARPVDPFNGKTYTQRTETAGWLPVIRWPTFDPVKWHISVSKRSTTTKCRIPRRQKATLAFFSRSKGQVAGNSTV